MEKTSKALGLSLIGFDEKAKKNFSAILSLAERRLERSWCIVDISLADFFLLSTEKSQSELIIVEKNLPREKCIFCTQQRLFEYEDNVLFFPLKQVPQLSSIVKVLNQITKISFFEEAPSKKLLSSPAVELNKAVTLKRDNNFFDPDYSVLKDLLHNGTDQKVYCFNSPESSHSVYIDPLKKLYYCETSLKNLDPYLTIENAVTIKVVSHEEWNNSIEKLALFVRPLNNLIWYIAFKLSNGNLLLGHSDQDNVCLTRWPDLSIEGCAKYVKLAAFMRNNSVCLTTVADKTGIPLGQVYAFYNACYLIGITEKTDGSELRTKVIDEDRQQIFSKITSRLEETNNGKKE